MNRNVGESMKNKTGIYTLRTAVILLLMITLALTASCIPAFAAEDPPTESADGDASASAPVVFADDSLLGEVRQVRVSFPDAVDEEVIEWDFPYSDAFFSMPSSAFSMTMARASMGLTVSAFRSPLLSFQYESYLRGAGFTEITGFGYDKAPSEDSVSGVIGMKRIGDCTVIAAAACGQGYGNEWASNFKVGEGERHEGFSTAARLFEDQLAQYLKDRGIEGRKKLWVSGFSRASAVGNILAADMIESGEFDEVYAYLFGVPRTTRQPVQYPGIYNVCGQYDPVPEVPLQTWDYERYGTDLYTPAQESTAEYASLARAARAVGDSLDGAGFRNNPEVNYQLRLILESLGEFFPDCGAYCEKMQGLLADAIVNHSEAHVLELLTEAFAGLQPEKTQDRAKIDTFMDYVGYVAGQHLRADQRQVEEGSWDPDETLAENLALEHMPVTYMRWLFSEGEPQRILTGSDVSRRISLIGPVGITVLKDGRAIKYIDKNGKISWPQEEEYGENRRDPDVFLMRNENITVVSLPDDEEYMLTVGTDRRCTMTFYDLLVSPRKLAPEAGKINLAEMSEGRYGFPVIPGSENRAEPIEIAGNYILVGSSDYSYSPTTVMNDELQATRHYFMSLRRVYRLVVNTVLGLVIYLLLCLAQYLVHRHKVKNGHPPYSKWYVIVPHLITIAGLTILTVMLTYHLFAIDKVRIVLGSLIMLTIFLLSLRGTLRYKRKSSIALTVFLFINFAVTFLFFNRTEKLPFSWVTVTVFALVVGLLTAAAVWTFREPEEEDAPAPGEALETAE